LNAPTTGSLPKNAFEQLAVPATVFCSQELPAPYRTTRVPPTLKASFSLATKIQSLPLGDVAAGAAADVGADATAASVASASLAPPLPPPQPAKRTATEQKSKCTGFN
jgi:hypothetical protein